MESYSVSPAGPNAVNLPCRLLGDHGRCGRPVRFVVDQYDPALGETPQRPLIQFGACADHADLYR
jgi:hypothetical protein